MDWDNPYAGHDVDATKMNGNAQNRMTHNGRLGAVAEEQDEELSGTCRAAILFGMIM